MIRVFGDLHGRTHWQQEVKDKPLQKGDFDIFLGDYVDDWTAPDKQIIDNLHELIRYKQSNSDQVILLLGNHDNQYYFSGSREWQCSGYRESYSMELNRIFQDNRKCFQAAFEHKGCLYTHAGLGKHFLKALKKKLGTKFKQGSMNYAEFLNEVFKNIPNYLADVGQARGGWSTWGGIFWADKIEFNDPTNHIKGLNQVVGHQPMKEITTETCGNDTMTWCDVGSHPKGNGKDIYICG